MSNKILNKKTIEDIQVKGKKVIVRVDFNVPLDENRNITNDKRIVSALPTIKYLVDNGAKTILVSHLGRPKEGPEEKFSMKPTAKRLSELLGQEVIMAKDVIGPDAKKSSSLKDGEVLMLENVRFHRKKPKTIQNSQRTCIPGRNLCKRCLRNSTQSPCLNSRTCRSPASGMRLSHQKEIEFMGSLFNQKNHSSQFCGAKVSDKIKVIENLLDKVDTLIIGGGMAFTFLKPTAKT